LASLLLRQSRFQDAVHEYSMILRSQVRGLGVDNLETLITSCNLALSLIAIEDYSSALSLLAEIENGARRELDAHSDIANRVKQLREVAENALKG
jgi:uncharacterized protein (DUF1697 family)